MKNLLVTILCLGAICSAQARMQHKPMQTEAVRDENMMTQMRIDQNKTLENARHEFQKLHAQVEKAQQENDPKIALKSLEHIEKETHATAANNIGKMKNLFNHQADQIKRDEQRGSITLAEYKKMMDKLEKNYASDEKTIMREEADVVSAIGKAVGNLKSGVDRESYSLSNKERSMSN